jgi:hypothetical protein
VRKPISAEGGGNGQRDLEIVTRGRAEPEALRIVPTIDEVRAALASIPGSLSRDDISERGEY